MGNNMLFDNQIDKFNTSLLFENYENYVNDEDNDLQHQESAVRLLREESVFQDFADTLLEGLNDKTRAAVGGVLDQHRLNLLNEAANVSSSVFTH